MFAAWVPVYLCRPGTHYYRPQTAVQCRAGWNLCPITPSPVLTHAWCQGRNLSHNFLIRHQWILYRTLTWVLTNMSSWSYDFWMTFRPWVCLKCIRGRVRSVAWESHFTITESPGSASGTGGSDLSMRDTGCHPSLSSRDDGKLESYACFRLYAKINQKQTSIFYVQVLLELTYY